MQDFVSKVNDYLYNKYEGRLVFGNVKINGLTNMFIAFFPKGSLGSQAYHVYDREDFEEQVYDYVNEKLKLCIEET